jgi:putative NIF3 family GTP cyclohydrolase 1 type 2
MIKRLHNTDKLLILLITTDCNTQAISEFVSANQDLIDAAIDEKTDALFVHHGFFWKNEAAEIIGIKKIG